MDALVLKLLKVNTCITLNCVIEKYLNCGSQGFTIAHLVIDKFHYTLYNAQLVVAGV